MYGEIIWSFMKQLVNVWCHVLDIYEVADECLLRCSGNLNNNVLMFGDIFQSFER